MAFYVSAVDNLLKTEVDQPTNAKRGASNGIILYKSKDKTIAEYALQPLQNPISVATYRLKDTLPEPLKDSLPTIAQLEMELETVDVEEREN